MKHLYVCRHGESQLNLEGIYSGQTDTPLTDHGREQARLAGSGASNLNLELIVTSPLIRALETAQIIASQIGYPADGIITNALAMERSYGSLECHPWTIAADPAVFPDIETEDALLSRARQTLDFLQGLEQDAVLLVSHGTFLLTLSNLISADAPKQELHNAVVVQLI
jgi:uncharacterized phosphatase